LPACWCSAKSSAITTLVRTAQADLIQDHINQLIQRQSATVGLGFYDSAEYYDKLHQARNAAAYRPVAMLETLGSLLMSTITLVSMVAVVTRFGVWMAAALLLGILPALYVYLSYAARQHKWRVRTTPDERRAWYGDICGKRQFGGVRRIERDAIGEAGISPTGFIGRRAVSAKRRTRRIGSR
jgi:hypothetical protein